MNDNNIEAIREAEWDWDNVLFFGEDSWTPTQVRDILINALDEQKDIIEKLEKRIATRDEIIQDAVLHPDAKGMGITVQVVDNEEGEPQ